MKARIDHKEMFDGFQKTPLLWNSVTVNGLKQFHIQSIAEEYLPKPRSKPLRLGKWVETYTSFQLNGLSHIEVLEENVQIKCNKQTIGELDFLILKKNQPIHLEIAYKFFLYDTKETYPTAIEHWIGPNRNDSLSQKIKKLSEKQLPLLHKAETQSYLQKLNINSTDFKQYVNIKAQLFSPFHFRNIDIEPLNKDCIKGWYINFDSLSELKDFQFYIPTKLHWLCEPKLKIDWLNFDIASSVIKTFIENKQSPLCWIKKANNELQKCFITWW